jgi:hypothetical protein
VLEVENIGELRLICQSYLRILVEIDATKPLKPGFFHARVGGIPLRILCLMWDNQS